jgi:hypothetical protein
VRAAPRGPRRRDRRAARAVGDREPLPATPVALPAATRRETRETLATLCGETAADHALLLHRGGALVATAGDVDVAAAKRYARARAAGDEDLAAFIRLGACPSGGAIVCFREVGDGWRLEVGFTGAPAADLPRPDDPRIERTAARLAAVLAGAG